MAVAKLEYLGLEVIIMAEEGLDFCGKVCPYPVVNVIRAVDRLRAGESIKVRFNDPLASRSIPEELEEYKNLTFSGKKRQLLGALY